MNEPERRHPDPETLAAFADGRLQGRAIEAVVEHLDECGDCMSDVALAMKGPVERGEKRGWMPWLLAAAVVAIVIAAVPMLELPWRSPVDRLVALAPKNARTVEPRLTGGFAWAAWRGAARAAGDAGQAEILTLGGAAGEIIERAQSDTGAAAQHAAGVAMVLMQKPEEGMARLERAARGSQDAKTLSDLAAARYAAASSLGRAALYPLALAAADEALRLEPGLAEALFNRALILERMGLTREARRAWERYLEVDPASPWANEAREHLRDLPADGGAARFERDRTAIEQAALRGDRRTLLALAAAHRGRLRPYAEAEYLGRWADAVQQQDDDAAARWLTIARGVGEAVHELAGETLLRDAVRAIDTATDAARARIALAQTAYRRARIAYSRQQQLDRVELDLRRAAEELERAGSPMALVARYYAASARLARNDTGGARAELEALRAAAAAHPGHIAIGARIRWELGRAYILDSDWLAAAAVLGESAALFRRSGDRSSEGFVESMQARALTALGRGDDAWSARIRAFGALSAENESDWLAVSVADATRAELLEDRAPAALALSSLALPESRADLAIDRLVHRAMLEAATGNGPSAVRTARQAEALARGVPDAALRARRLADVDVATGAALAESDPRTAVAALSRAIDFYEANGVAVRLPEPLLVRARCALRAGDGDAAERDLERGIAVAERYRRDGGRAVTGSGVVDVERALFAEAIALQLDRGAAANAFAYAERLRGAAVSIDEVQRRLAGSGMVLLASVVLPRELVTFAIAEDRWSVERAAAPQQTVTALAQESLSENATAAAAALYELLIRPAEEIAGRARGIVIVPDPHLATVPFAALYDQRAKRYLIERLPVAMASSAGSLERVERGAARSAVLIALPSGAAVALPEAERELDEVAALYARATAIPPSRATLASLRANADVVHIAGHTERQAGGEQALSLAETRATWKTIVSGSPIQGGVVVLAACETLRPPASAETRGPSLGAAFAAAGARDVIGTLTPIGDREARVLFRAVHRRLAAGDTAMEALRAAQREAIDSRHGRAWQAVALLTRGIDRQE